MGARLSTEERKLIDAALAAGAVTRVATTAPRHGCAGREAMRSPHRMASDCGPDAPTAAPAVSAAELRPGRGVKVAVPIEDLLHWAFGREKVRLEFDDGMGGAAGGFGYASSTAAIIEHEKLGCRISGGGTSAPHPDAEAVAAAVAGLPLSCGGRGMALQIAELSRAGARPDWGARLGPCRCAPVEWKDGKHGRHARRMFWDGSGRWPQTVLGRDHGYACAVTFTGTAADHAAARRGWLLWYGALLELRAALGVAGVLSGWQISGVMPPRAPWSGGAGAAMSGAVNGVSGSKGG